MKRWAIAIGVVVVVAATFFARHRAASPARSGPVVLHDVIEADGVRVDLYLPASGMPAHWMVFVEEHPARPAFGEEMQRRGIAVALVSREAKRDEDPRRAGERVAGVVRVLTRRATDYGLVPQPVLAGNDASASLVALLALDARFGLDPASLMGVVAMNGIYDEPLRYVNANAPPFLVLSAHGESPEHAQGARSFGRALEQAGAKLVRSYHVSTRDERALADLSGDRNEIADLIASFVRGEPSPGGPESTWAVADAWGVHAPLSTESFWVDERLIVRRPTDDAVRAELGRVFADTMRDLEPWPRRRYDSIDLDDYLGAHPDLGSGDWLVVTNARGEQLVLSRAEIHEQKPRIVVGIDDERNLFRLLVTYNVYRSYTFRPDTEPRHLLARPVGGFLYFPGADGVGARTVTFADFALTPASFRVVGKDPNAVARALAKALARALTAEQGCLQCHSLRSAGARSHHLRAVDGAATGGEALALEEYPQEVMRRFLFEQDDVAKIFGVAPIRVDKDVATELLAMSSHR